jgi:hypothetical protein
VIILLIKIDLGGTQQGTIRFDFNQVGLVRSLFQAMANKCPEVFLAYREFD